MPTKYSPGQRIVHKTLGPGTVTEAEGDSVRVELDADDGARVRTFMTTRTLQPEPETPTMPDALLTAMNAALTERGKGAIAGLTATLGISKNTPNNWRHLGRIPDHQRDAVQAWIDKGQILAIRVEKTKPAPKVKPGKIAKPLKLRIVKRLKPDELRPSDVPPIRSAIDHGTVLQALGLTITTAWLPEGETMRQVRVAVLP